MKEPSEVNKGPVAVQAKRLPGFLPFFGRFALGRIMIYKIFLFFAENVETRPIFLV